MGSDKSTFPSLVVYSILHSFHFQYMLLILRLKGTVTFTSISPTGLDRTHNSCESGRTMPAYIRYHIFILYTLTFKVEALCSVRTSHINTM